MYNHIQKISSKIAFKKKENVKIIKQNISFIFIFQSETSNTFLKQILSLCLAFCRKSFNIKTISSFYETTYDIIHHSIKKIIMLKIYYLNFINYYKKYTVISRKYHKKLHKKKK